MSFFTRPPFNPWLSTLFYCLHCLCYLRPILPSIIIPPTSVVTKVIFMATCVPIATATATNTGLTFMVFKGLLTLTGSRVTGSITEGTLVLCSGLLNSPLSRMSSVSSASLSVTQPLNALSFVAMDNNQLPILLLVMFLLLLGPRTLVQTNTLRLILWLCLSMHPISVMIICMLVTVKAFPYPILGIPCYILQNTFLPYLTFFKFLKLSSDYFLFRNFIMIIMSILNFMHLCFI